MKSWFDSRIKIKTFQENDEVTPDMGYSYMMPDCKWYVEYYPEADCCSMNFEKSNKITSYL